MVLVGLLVTSSSCPSMTVSPDLPMMKRKVRWKPGRVSCLTLALSRRLPGADRTSTATSKLGPSSGEGWREGQGGRYLPRRRRWCFGQQEGWKLLWVLGTLAQLKCPQGSLKVCVESCHPSKEPTLMHGFLRASFLLALLGPATPEEQEQQEAGPQPPLLRPGHGGQVLLEASRWWVLRPGKAGG